MAFLLIQSQVAYQDANGNPLAGGLMYVYDSGTTNPHNTYPTSALSGGGGANTNPLVADASGRFGAAYIEDGTSVKVIIKDSTQANTIFSNDPITSPAAASASVPSRTYTTKNTDYTLQSSDKGGVIGVDASGADRTITLVPSISGNNGYPINISKISVLGLVTIQPNGGTIDGASSLVLDTQYEDAELVCQGSAGWHVVGQTAAEPRGELPLINAQTGASYTLVIGDKGAKITMNNSGANTVIFPTNASVPFPLNSRVEISSIGAGQTTIASAGGVPGPPSIFSFGSPTANSGWLKIAGQYAGVIATKIGVNSWLVEGSLTA